MKKIRPEMGKVWKLLIYRLLLRLSLFLPVFVMALSLSAQDRQLIRGVIIDEATRQVIPFAHLQFKISRLGTVANQEGAFSSFIKGGASDDTLFISSMGYETSKIHISEVMTKDTFLLKEASITLHPILITTLSAEEIVRKSIQSISKNYPQNDVHFIGFYRTATKECQTFVKLLEGPVSVADPGYASKDTANITYLNVSESEDFSQYKLEEKHLMEDALTFEHIRLRSGFLNPDALDGWKYEMAGYTQYDGKGVMIILANYISDKHKMDHSARIYIDDSSFAIYKLEYTYHWLDNYFIKSEIDSLSEAEHQWEGEFHYAQEKDKFYLKYFVFHHTKTLYDLMFKRKVCDIEVYSEFNRYEVAEKANALRETYSGHSLELAQPIETELYKNIFKDLDSLSRAGDE
ncbi:carboxypeptidase-like regulatory domain-containing protein [Catalinimonas niigatensis]|uniref:carboxypeptidase-like regulatory domain-containing protein n=1 Tax=Catalinimonas niigatensis TaxID=1397264 RepID=UPI002666F7F9|nr:carboxypeptidase-like regulatory domain-containing protein [Catalinimonas niigatensis]WPP52400.1 carboxypeptidase-like regulatory domain-containing protein [Catalinimonas niigatensis]